MVIFSIPLSTSISSFQSTMHSKYTKTQSWCASSNEDQRPKKFGDIIHIGNFSLHMLVVFADMHTVLRNDSSNQFLKSTFSSSKTNHSCLRMFWINIKLIFCLKFDLKCSRSEKITNISSTWEPAMRRFRSGRFITSRNTQNIYNAYKVMHIRFPDCVITILSCLQSYSDILGRHVALDCYEYCDDDGLFRNCGAQTKQFSRTRIFACTQSNIRVNSHF